MYRPGLTRERLVGLFLLGVLLFTPPILGIFNTPGRVFGIPNLYFYLFVSWACLILLIAVVIETSDADDPADDAPDGQAGSDVTTDK